MVEGLHESKVLLHPGLLRVDRILTQPFSGPGLNVTGPFWVYRIFEVISGQVVAFRGTEEIQPPSAWHAYVLPPYSISHLAYRNACTRSFAFICNQPPPKLVPSEPRIFAKQETSLPATLKEIEQCLRQHQDDGVSLATPREAISSLAMRTKAAMEREYLTSTRVGEIAARLKTSNTVVAREFKKAFGITPVEYRRSLRVIVSMMMLAEGVAIDSTAAAAGYADLSRFYKQFKKLRYHSPKTYQLKKS